MLLRDNLADARAETKQKLEHRLHFTEPGKALPRIGGPSLPASADAARLTGLFDRSAAADDRAKVPRVVDVSVPRGFILERGHELRPLIGREEVTARGGILESATKLVSFFIDHRCEQIIADNEQCVWDEEGTHLKKWGKRAGGILYVRGHLLDAISYLTHQKFPMGGDVKPQTAAEILGGLNAWHSDLKEPRMY